MKNLLRYSLIFLLAHAGSLGAKALDLLTLKKNADAEQGAFMAKVKATEFKNEEFKKLFDLWLDKIKVSMKKNKQTLQEKSDAKVADELRTQGKLPGKEIEENLIAYMMANIKWLTKFYEKVAEMIQKELAVLTALKDMDDMIAPTTFLKQFDPIFEPTTQTPSVTTPEETASGESKTEESDEEPALPVEVPALPVEVVEVAA